MKSFMKYGVFLLIFFLINKQYCFSQDSAWSDKFVCKGSSITIGDEGSSGACYSWTSVPSDPNIANLKTKEITVTPSQTTTYTRITVGNEFSSRKTDAVSVQVLTGFTIALLQTSVCDGEKVGIKLNPIPSNFPRTDFAGCLTNVRFTSKTVSPSFGNPIGTTTLAFDPLNNNAESKIQNAIWYSTQVNHCNDSSEYEISATSTLNSDTTSSANKVTLFVEATLGKCLDGNIYSTDQWFSGNPIIETTQLQDNTWKATVKIGTFQKHVIVGVYYKAPINSQYYLMVKDEELYHKGQWEGTNLSTLLSDLFLAQTVIDAANLAAPSGATETEAIADANAKIIIARDNEISVSLVIAGSRRCATEREAKIAVGSSHKAWMPCTYPSCPN